MSRKKQLERASCHSGKANKQGVAYNANHNTMEQARANQPHIDQERMVLNSYLQYFGDRPTVRHQGGQGGYDSRKHEMQRFRELYGKGLEERNARYKASGHKDRCKTMAKVYRDPKTCPTEIIFQVGNSESETDKEKRTAVMVGAWAATMREFQEKYGANFIPLDSALHRDEAEDHIHFRFTLGATDKFGNFVPNQSAALEQMGFKADPERARGRYNNPLIAFTDELRETYYRECERRGITINREVKSESRRQLELLAVKCEGFRKELEQLEADRQAALTDAQVARDNEAKAKAEKLAAEQAVQTAQEALEKVIGDTDTLNKQIKALEASQTALEAENEHLSDKNTELQEKVTNAEARARELKAKNDRLTAEKNNLSNKVAQLKLQIQGLENTKRAAELKAEQAKADRQAAVDAAKDMEAHQKELYRIYNGRSAKTHGEVPAKPAKKNWKGEIVQQAVPACTLVETESLKNLEKAAAYSHMVDYAQDEMAKLDKKIAENEIIQQQKKTIVKMQQQINELEQQTRNDELTIVQQGNTIDLQQQVLQQNGLDWIVQQFGHTQAQDQDEEIKPEYE